MNLYYGHFSCMDVNPGNQLWRRAVKITCNLVRLCTFHFDTFLASQINSNFSKVRIIKDPSRSREVILQDLARFLQKRVILQDLARWRLSCKILQDGGYLARILKEGGYLARILQESCKITIPKFLSKNTKKITEIRCKIKKIVSRTRCLTNKISRTRCF